MLEVLATGTCEVGETTIGVGEIWVMDAGWVTEDFRKKYQAAPPAITSKRIKTITSKNVLLDLTGGGVGGCRLDGGGAVGCGF
ncbi:MAG: hypothetical protein M1365_16730 [Actinobacteria bacterium]|nr:hypothetical protein [Actinomycetota bacterium]